MVQVGGVVSTAYVIVIMSDPALPAASCDVTVITLLPTLRAMLAIVQLVVPVAVPDPPSELTHVTLVTPMLSEAVPPRLIGDEIVEYTWLLVGDVIVQVGGTRSILMVIVSMPVLPAALCAVMVIRLLPLERDKPIILQLVVPEAVPKPPVAAFVQVTLVTPTLSDAVPARLMVWELVQYVGLLVGEVIVQVGPMAANTSIYSQE